MKKKFNSESPYQKLKREIGDFFSLICVSDMIIFKKYCNEKP